MKVLKGFLAVTSLVCVAFFLSACQKSDSQDLSPKSLENKLSQDTRSIPGTAISTSTKKLEIKEFLSKTKTLSPLEGQQAIDFTLTDVDGNKVSLKDYKGKVIFVVFWATWCPYCINEMPHLGKMYDQLKDEKDFAMLAISLDQPVGKSKESMEDLQDQVSAVALSHGGSFPILFDPTRKIADIYTGNKTPTAFIIDKDGTILGKFQGERGWDKKEYIDLFKALIKRK